MKQLSAVDLIMLLADSPRTPNHMGPLLICDPRERSKGSLSFDELSRSLLAQLHHVPLLRRRLVSDPLGLDNPYWADDPDFDIEFHVRHTALPRPGGWAELTTELAHVAARNIDLSRPPWELYLIEGLDSVPDVPSGAHAVFIKIHHAAIDGREGLELLNVLTTTDPGAYHPVIDDTPPWHPHSLPSGWDLLRRSIASLPARPGAGLRLITRALPALAGRVVDIARGTARPAVPTPYSRFSGVVGPHRVFDATIISLPLIKQARTHVTGATVNDVVLAIVGGALRRYLTAHDDLPQDSLSAGVPISTRAAEGVGSGGNEIDSTKVSLGTDIDNDIDRLAAISAATRNIRTERNGVGAAQMADLAEVVPGRLLGTGLRATAELAARARIPTVANVVVTNVPGPRVPLYFLGSRVTAMYGFGPVSDGMGLIHLVGSYCDDLTLSVVADRAMLPDVEFYIACVQAAFDGLRR